MEKGVSVAFCTKCGKQLDEGVKFCTSCGAPVPVAKPQPKADEVRETDEVRKLDESRETDDPRVSGDSVEKMTEAKPSSFSADSSLMDVSDGVSAAETSEDSSISNSRNRIIIGIMGVILIVVIIAVCVFFFGKSEQQSSDEGIQQATWETEEGSVDPTFESKCFRVILPENIASLVAFEQKNNTVSMKYASSGTSLGVLFPQGEALVSESANRSYILGEVYLSGHYEEAMLDLVYIEADGTAAHWGSKQPRELAIEKLLGVTCEEFISYISLNTGSEFVPAQIKLKSDDGAISTEETEGVLANDAEKTAAVPENADSSPVEPFWGIWISASKSEFEMAALIQQLKGDGFENSVMTMTTDWSNLNPEPWWVVSAGRYASEEQANSALSEIKQKGYTSAYVKYTGSKR